MRICMIPGPKGVAVESGINAVARAYGEYLRPYGVEFVRADQEMDLLAIHAGMTNKIGGGIPVVSILHGLYWTEDYPAESWEYKANRDVVSSMIHANQVTVPSEWVAETIRRDIRVNPHIIGHGVKWEDWQTPPEENRGYVLWNKNRAGDVCDPTPVSKLALSFPKVSFLSTFANGDAPSNVTVTGTMDHSSMATTVRRAGVYLATTKETFGIGILEAMASGVPVLGWRHGGVTDLVQHGVNGYLAEPGNDEDLEAGLTYCLRWREQLGQNGRELAKLYRWEDVVDKLYKVFELAVRPSPATVSVVIPCFNYAHTLHRAVASAVAQTVSPNEIVILDDGSSDNTREVAQSVIGALSSESTKITYYKQQNMGVANARNAGIRLTNSKYICCLDADDEISPEFLENCVRELENDSTLGLAYTRLLAIDRDGRENLSEWPGEYNFDRFVQGQNQVPTCCVFRRDLWSRLGGYRQRYAPQGAGAEDAEFWLRMGALGYGGKLATNRPLFIYHLGGRVSGNPKYSEENWRAWHPWVRDGRHPLASVATPENKQSHPVRQYDTPVISVVIPVGPGHVKYLTNAIDSVEAQTIRSWEIVLVNDSGEDLPDGILEAYPFVRHVTTAGRTGAGAARNRGAEAARGKFLIFLDADDWFEPDAFYSMLERMSQGEVDVVYSDYLGHAILEQREIQNMQREGRIKKAYEDGSAVIVYSSMDYDCELAQVQPEPIDGQVYVWCLVSALVPKSLHNAVGGFDETMQSWEDWDYWIRISRKGACFERLGVPLVNYRFGTGGRREIGISNKDYLLAYMQEKREKESAAVCGSCRKPRQDSGPSPLAQARYSPFAAARNAGVMMSTEGMTLVQLHDSNIGDHPIVGFVTKTHYGNRSSGEEFYMHEVDINAKPNRYVKVQAKPSVVMESVSSGQPIIPTPPPPSVLGKPDNNGKMEISHGGNPNVVDSMAALTPPTPVVRFKPESEKTQELDAVSYTTIDHMVLAGIINTSQLKALQGAGIKSYQDVSNLGADGLVSINGIGEITARKLLDEAARENV